MFLAILILILFRLLIRLISYLVDLSNYRQELKEQKTGYPKAYYPKLNKPKFFK